MSLLIPDNEKLFRIFHLVESEVASLLLEYISGRKVTTPKTIKNIFSGKHKPKWSLLERIAMVTGDDQAVVKKARTIDQTIREKLGADLVCKHIVPWASFSAGLRIANPDNYVADVIDGIVNDEKRILTLDKSRQLTEICCNPTVLNILRTDEIKALKNADISTKTVIALIPLRLKILLYMLAAFEVNGFYSEAEFPDTSVCIAHGKHGAVSVLFEILVKSTKCNYTAFARKYLTDEKEEDSAVKKLQRWRKGKSIPPWETFLKFADNFCNDRVPADHHDSCKGRLTLLFALAVFSHNVAMMEERLGLNLEWGKAYKKFLHTHIAEIKKRGEVK